MKFITKAFLTIFRLPSFVTFLFYLIFWVIGNIRSLIAMMQLDTSITLDLLKNKVDSVTQRRVLIIIYDLTVWVILIAPLIKKFIGNG